MGGGKKSNKIFGCFGVRADERSGDKFGVFFRGSPAANSVMTITRCCRSSSSRRRWRSAHCSARCHLHQSHNKNRPLPVRGYSPKKSKRRATAGMSGWVQALRHHGEEQKYCEDYQVNDALKHGSSAGAQCDHAGEQRQCQQDLVLRPQPELERLADHD